MSTDYKCCLCQVVSANCTRKCIICASGEKRICNSCLARNNKCLECRGGDGTILTKDNEKPSKKPVNKRKKSTEEIKDSAPAVVNPPSACITAQIEEAVSSSIASRVAASTAAAKIAASALSEKARSSSSRSDISRQRTEQSSSRSSEGAARERT